MKRTIAWGSEVFECFESNYIQFANLANELFPSFIRDEKVKVSNTESLSTKGGKRTKRKRQTETADIPIQPLTFPKFHFPTHTQYFVEQYGWPCNWDVEHWERFHKECVKAVCDGANKTKAHVGKSMMKGLGRSHIFNI